MRNASPVLFALCLAGGCQAKSAPPPKVATEEPASAAAATSDAGARTAPADDAAIEKLIAQLSDVDRAGIGYSPSVTGQQFLPAAAASDEQGMLLLGQLPPKRSPVLTRIVAAGAKAVPALLDCLDDATPTKLPPMKPMMWSANNNEYDFNRRTAVAPPAGVNRDEPPDGGVAYVVTVGDLCFVALGQIVNRSFAAVRYQPSGGLIISSPAGSAPLRDAARAEWSGLTAKSLRASLVRDFDKPDWEGRRAGALRRLAYYFPDAVAPLMKAELARPTFDVDAVQAEARALYGMSGAQRKAAFATFVKRHGPAARDGLLQALFADLSTQEAYEEKRISPPGTGSGYRARRCLVELYGYPGSVRAEKDKPYPEYSNSYERERLVEAAKR